RVAQQPGEVERRTGAEQRQGEAVLPLDRPVTGPAVATQPAEHRLDVAREAGRLGRPGWSGGGGEAGAGEQDADSQEEAKVAAHTRVLTVASLGATLEQRGPPGPGEGPSPRAPPAPRQAKDVPQASPQPPAGGST